MRLVMAGTLPPPICGTTVSLVHLMDDLEQRHSHSVELTFIDTGGIRRRGIRGGLRMISVLARLLWHGARSDVVALHLSPYAVVWLGAYGAILQRLFHFGLVIRVFGGNCFFDDSGLSERLFRFALRRSIYLAQTHAMVAKAVAKDVPRVRWFPTSRPPVDRSMGGGQSNGCRRFVYAGWVSVAKGIPELFATERLIQSANVSIDVFGVLVDGISEKDFERYEAVRYKGVLPPRTVGQRLLEYDALVFPSTYIGEGYPGAIVEAFQAGLPVIATNWRHIPELVDDSCGILVEPKSISDLAAAIDRLVADRALFERLKAGARARSTQYATPVWTDKFLDYCREAKTAWETPQ